MIRSYKINVEMNELKCHIHKVFFCLAYTFPLSRMYIIEIAFILS